MAGLASHALLDVDAVVEIHEIRQVVNAHPVHRAVLTEAGANGFENRRLRPDLRMAVHAGLRRGNPGERRRFYRRVAVPAVDPVVFDVVAMAELNRLLDELL